MVDFGRFCTGFLVVMGIGKPVPNFHFWGHTDDLLNLALPALLAHCGLIELQAMMMSVVGGLLIYGTIISFTMFFQEEQDF